MTMNNKVISLFDFGQGNNAPENINDYMGRHVYIYNNVYAVTAVKPSERMSVVGTAACTADKPYYTW